MLKPAATGPLGPKARPRPLLRTTLGGVLRRTRRAQGRTLADVARAARVSMPYLSEVERGRKEASSEVLAAICDALRIELSDLLAVVGHDLAQARRARAADRARARRAADRDLEVPAPASALGDALGGALGGALGDIDAPSAQVLRLTPAATPAPDGPALPAPGRRLGPGAPGDVTCLLAA